MPRRSRLDILDAFFYITLRSNAELHIFSHERDHEDFERYLRNALKNCHASAYAFAWQPDAAHLLVEVTEIPVGRFVQRLTCQFARNLHRTRGGAGHLFQQRYQARLVDPDVYLPRLIRFLHLLPVAAGATNGIEHSRLSSHSAYLGITHIDWLTRAPGLTDEAYAELMKTPPIPGDASLFENGPKWDPRVIGSKEFLMRVQARQRRRQSNEDLDQIINSVSQKIGVDPQAVVSKSRQRKLALARALVGWLSIKRRICTLAEVSRKLRRDPATIFVGMTRYRALKPDLFED